MSEVTLGGSRTYQDSPFADAVLTPSYAVTSAGELGDRASERPDVVPAIRPALRPVLQLGKRIPSLVDVLIHQVQVGPVGFGVVRIFDNRSVVATCRYICGKIPGSDVADLYAKLPDFHTKAFGDEFQGPFGGGIHTTIWESHVARY